MPGPSVVRYQPRADETPTTTVGANPACEARFGTPNAAINWALQHRDEGGRLYEVHTADGAQPITRATLHRMIATCDPATLLGTRDRALLAYTWHYNGTRADVIWTEITRINRGFPLPGWVADPIRDWLLALSIAQGHPALDGFLFRPINRHDHLTGRPHLSPHGFDDIVNRIVTAADLPDPDRYSTRSLRLGGRLGI